MVEDLEGEPWSFDAFVAGAGDGVLASSDVGVLSW